MTRSRGRPAPGTGVARDDILTTALTLLDEGGGQGLTMRALAARLGVTPMSLYRHVGDHVGLLRALSDRVYAEVLESLPRLADHRAEIQTLLIRYHQAVGRHPQLTLAIFATPAAFAGVTRQITGRLTTLLAEITAEPILWRDILVDHAHGSGLALASARGDEMQTQAMLEQYQQALDRLLDRSGVLRTCGG
jgi:AcrR family transcriptional regulator